VTRSWKYRRRAALGTLTAALCGVGYLIGWGEDTDLHRRALDGLVTVITAVIGLYIGGATIDDGIRDYMHRRSGDENRGDRGPQRPRAGGCPGDGRPDGV
jgi:hypothetical protein